MSQPLNEPGIQSGEPIGKLTTPAGQPDETAVAFKADDELAPRTKTILFVEDEEFVRKVTREVLQSAGYRVLTAGSAAEALRTYDQHRSGVDLLLTDVVLPGNNGRVLAKELRREDEELKVLLVTGYGDQMEFNQRQPPVEKCLFKPFSARMLLRTVREVLEEASSKRCDPVMRAGDSG